MIREDHVVGVRHSAQERDGNVGSVVDDRHPHEREDVVRGDGKPGQVQPVRRIEVGDHGAVGAARLRVVDEVVRARAAEGDVARLEHDQVVARPRVEDVVAVIADEDVAAWPPDDVVISAVADEDVVTLAADEEVGAEASFEHVVSVFAVGRDRAGGVDCVHVIVARPGVDEAGAAGEQVDGVDSGASHCRGEHAAEIEGVVAVPGKGEGLIAGADQRVVADAPDEGVGPAVADQHVVAVSALDEVVERGADDGVRAAQSVECDGSGELREVVVAAIRVGEEVGLDRLQDCLLQAFC
jgi:hypothetical protein